MQRPHQKMDCFLLLSQQLICCVTLLLIKFVPVSNTVPLVSIDSTNPALGNTHTSPQSVQLKPHHINSHISETVNIHIQPTSVKQATPTKVTNLIAVSTEAIINSQSAESHHPNQQHKHRYMIQSLKGSKEYQSHLSSSTMLIIQPTPTQVQPIQTKTPQFGNTKSMMTSFPTFTEVASDFSKMPRSSTMQTLSDRTWREMTSIFSKDFKISTTKATNIGIKSSIFPRVSPQTNPESSTQQQTSTYTTPTAFDNQTSFQTQDRTLKKLISQASNSTAKPLIVESTLKTTVNPISYITEQSIQWDTKKQTKLTEFFVNQDNKNLSSEVIVNTTISPFFIQPTPSTNENLLIPQLKTKYKHSHLNSPSRYSTQRPTRNIISLDERIHSRWRSSKASTTSRNGLLHLTEDDPPTSNVYKPLMTNRKSFTSLPRNTNGRFLAAVTTEFMKSSEVIPDLFVAPTKTLKTHSTQNHYGGQGAIFTAISSVTTALSFKSKEEPLILSATATLKPSRMTYTCTIPCSQPGCTCCPDKQPALVTATTTVTGKPPNNATPNIEVSTNKSLTDQISLSAKFGIGMGCLIAIWLVVGPVICLICRIRDKVKESEDSVDGIGVRKKKKQAKERSASTKLEHPLAETIVMDELNKQFSKKKSTRENEYLLLAKDKAELECLSREDISKTISNKPMSTFDRTRKPHCLNRWDESDVEDDSEEDGDEKDRLSPLSNTPTVSV